MTYSKFAPITDTNRIVILDILRGIAVLGILTINIIAMGMHFGEIQYPGSIVIPAGPSWVAWIISATLFEGTFRTIFGILFGAGIYLFMSRAEEKHSAQKAKKLHLKRSLWLIILGIIDSYLLLWYGDVLFVYGFIGLFLWLFRKSGYKALGFWLAAFLTISILLKITTTAPIENTGEDATAYAKLSTAIEAGQPLSPEQQAEYQSLKMSQFLLSVLAPSPQQVEDQVKQIQSGYIGAWKIYAPLMLVIQTLILGFFMLWDCMISMILGLILFKSGFLKGGSKTPVYIVFIVLGYGVALPLRTWEMLTFSASSFNPEVYAGFMVYYDFFRISVALAHISLIILLVKYHRMPFKKYFAATGKMALTNYLLHSFLGLVFFILLGFYMRLNRAELELIILPVWIAQMLFSRYWLGKYSQGPMEAIWRRLTYGKLGGGIWIKFEKN